MIPDDADDHGEQNVEEREYRGERLQRVLAQRGVASRRRSERMITAGQVRVNGDVVTELGTRVDPARDEIQVDGNVLRRQPPRYIMLNKPTGFITTVSDERDRWTVMDLVKVRERVYPVGRLDRATQGLVLLTNDGDLAHRVTHPSYRIDKEYLVFAETRPAENQLQRLRDGITIDDKLVQPVEVRLFRESAEGIAIKIVLHEGLYHVVRRLMDTVGITVTRLRRTRLGPLHLQAIPPGAWRDLTPGELNQIFQAVGMSAEAADRANSQRALQLTPVGGFAHPVTGRGDAAAKSSASATPPERSGAPRKPSETVHRRRGGRQTVVREKAPERGNRNDRNRSSSSRRDRRTGGRG